MKQAYKKDPTLLDSITIIKLDTIYTEPIVVQDTFVTMQVDTFEKVTPEYSYKLIRTYDTIIMNVECKPDTIFREVEFKCPPEVTVVDGVSKWWKYAVYGIIIMMLYFFFRKLFS